MLPLRELHAAPQYPTHAHYVTARRSPRLTVATTSSLEFQKHFFVYCSQMSPKRNISNAKFEVFAATKIQVVVLLVVVGYHTNTRRHNPAEHHGV